MKASAAVSLIALSGSACGPTSVSCEDVLSCGAADNPQDARADTGPEGATLPRDAAVLLDAGEEEAGSGEGTAPEPVEAGIAAESSAGADADAETPNRIEAGREDAADADEVGPTCDRETALEPGCVPGIFVAPPGAAATATGKRSAPFRTLAQGLAAAAASSRTVFVCDDGTGFREQMTVGATLDGLVVMGGYACGTWSRLVLGRTEVRPPVGPALVVQGLTRGLRLENFLLTAADATMPSASSIAATIRGSINVVLVGVRMLAGKGSAGAAGVDGAKGADGAESGPPQQGLPASCPAAGVLAFGGTWAQVSPCGSRGGTGGTANTGMFGASGVAGLPTTHVEPPNYDNAGPGAPITGAPGTAGGDGFRGANGVSGTNGAVAPAGGVFTAAGFTAAPPGGNGTDGWVGQGGGGGGASNATGTCVGASGGAGGMGGCGGKLGAGGGGGGASVALLSFGSSVTLDTCELLTGAGGNGGPGGNGGAGGLGRLGAIGGAGIPEGSSATGEIIGSGGRGGPGGNGGPGGAGAGGSGGPSYPVVYQGDAPVLRNGTVLTPGAGGLAGLGGATPAGVRALDGRVGLAAEQLVVALP